MRNPIILFFFLLIGGSSSYAQYTFNSLDSIVERCPLDSSLFYLKKQKGTSVTQEQKFTNYLNYASYYRRVSKIDSSFLSLNKAASLANTSAKKGIIQQREGLLYSQQHDYIKAKKHYLQALNYFSDTLNKAATYFSLSELYEKNGQLDSSWYSLLKSKRLYGLVDTKSKNYGTALNAIGVKYLHEAKYDSAYFYLLEALTIYEQCQDVHSIARTKDLIGTLFYYQESYLEAINYYKESYALFVQLNDVKSQISRLSNIGSSYKNIDSLDAAFYYFNQMYLLAVANSFSSLESISLSNLAIIEAENGNLKSAIRKQNRSLTIDYENKDLEGMAIGYLNLGDFYGAMEKKELAINNYEQALALGFKINRVNLIKETYKKISESNEGIRDDLALLYYKKYTSLNDSINDLEVKTSIEKLNIKYINKERAFENLELKANLEIKESLLLVNNQKVELEKTRKTVLFVIALFLIAVIAFLSYYFSSRSKKQKRELELINLQLEKEKLAQQSISERLALTQESIKQKNSVIQKFEKYINSPEASEQLLKNLSTDKDWAKFMIDFELLYPTYFDSLQLQENMELTKNDYRISALSHLKLSNKETAAILNITLSGVKIAKNRFNSKLKTAP